MRSLYLVDLDDTLIDTRRIKKLLPQFLNDFGIPPESFESDYLKIKSNRNGIYSIYDHVFSYTRDYTINDISNRFKKYFQDKNLLFEQSTRLIQFLKSNKNNRVVIFTFGDEDFQRLKVSIFPLLSEMDMIVTPQTKSKKIGELVVSYKSGFKFGKYNEIYHKLVYIDDRPDQNIVASDTIQIIDTSLNSDIISQING